MAVLIASALRKELSGEPLYPIIHLEGEDIEIAVTHGKHYGEEYWSFVNGQHTTMGGTHLAAFREALVETIRNHFKKDYDAADIRQSIWQKAAQMLANSTLCTLTELPVGAIRNDKALKELAAKAGAEGLAIAQALGVDVNAAPQRPSGGHASGAQAHKPSILQDYERGRPMEVETQLMAPLALARMAKVATPILDTLVPLVAAKAAAKGLYSH